MVAPVREALFVRLHALSTTRAYLAAARRPVWGIFGRPVRACDMAILEVRHLSKSFGTLAAVDDVSLRVEAGRLLGVLGPNGAGKTTTVSMVAGLLTPDR